MDLAIIQNSKNNSSPLRNNKTYNNDQIKLVKDLKKNDPYGYMVDPRKDQKCVKRYTTKMFLNYQISSLNPKNLRSYFIRNKSALTKANY